MYIEEVVIDGFKSYANRTVIQGFDPHFNAITGLNGSGKSNILDSICFVLGITNLSQVRAGNLSELVYKQGQAGVNKAIVTIVFNNEDKSCSPIGFEQCKEVTVTRQVLIGGKSKYMINGRNSPAGQVQNLFHSVQLNVNNPHFLIMQGRITKVLNMKPNEILGMVEEAAGTRMYETKRVAALKTIEKKQAKVDEINSVLSEEITPTLERLRGEKENYLKWSKLGADIERIDRFVIASDFMESKTFLENNSEGCDEMNTKIEDLTSKSDQLKQETLSIEEEMKGLNSKLKGEFEKALKDAKAEEEKRSKELVKVTSTWENSKDNVAKAEKDVEVAKALVEETKASIAAKENEHADDAETIKAQKQAATDAESKLAQLKSDYQNMSAGISSSQGDEALSLPDRIRNAYTESKSAEAKAKQAKMKINHLSKQIKNTEKDLKREEKANQKLATSLDKVKLKVEGIQHQIGDIGFSETEFNGLEQDKIQLETDIFELNSKINSLEGKLEGRLRFQYEDPVRGFDRSRVKGKLASLITVHNPKNATALEIVAGGKLFNVVVEDAITGKALLNKGKLQKRVTIIPLDKITGRHLADSVVKKASSVAKYHNATASPAIELIGFDEEVRTALEYVFGTSFVVDNDKAANQICDDTKTRAVTLEGDVYEPSGTISGGSKNQTGTFLEDFCALASARAERDEKQKALSSVKSKINALMAKSVEFGNLSAALDIALAELAGVEKHLSQTNYGILRQQFDSESKALEEAHAECEKMEKEKDEKWNLHNELKSREKELTQEREVRLKDLEEAVRAAKVGAAKAAKVAREADSKSQTIALELDNLKAELLASEEAVRAAEKIVKDANTEESDLQMKCGDVKARYDEAKEALLEVEKRSETCTSELNALSKERSKKEKEIVASTHAIAKLKVEIDKVQKERTTAERTVASYLKKYPWIESEQSEFGVSGGDYDFESCNAKEMSKQLKAQRAERESLAKSLNKKVMGMIEKAEGEYTELLRKRKVVENDKKKIQAVIEELDVKKKSELQRTWKKVNRDFGSIFSTLLPGTTAKLEPPEGMEAWEGLEVKVAFGEVWKESLSELSGGQRSLLALSLILSLLLFKPAPMYILDEVDAALDLSHTQNIGNMLKTHFSQSQFIVVSLKEGMFNNANVIFRTKFVDGVSTVNRTIGTGSSRNNALGNSENITSANQSKKRKGAGRRGVRAAEKENVVG